ncbi:MAG: DUF1848 domain-containing protein [Lachnospiraceae bacterium]|nr:DUF1848 domain-containing protein [Lachnospiraceae bacterium]
MNKLGDYYFQFTLTAYGTDVEKNIPSKNKIIIPAFQQLSKEIGKEKVVWRYDPIFFNKTYTIDYHCTSFEILASKLTQYTEKCTISFIDFYRNTERNVKPLNIQVITVEQQAELVERFVEIAKRYNMYIDICAENYDFRELGVLPAHCIDKERFERTGKYKLDIGKDKNQREKCGCIESIDIGAYNTCKNGCLYCYANYSNTDANNNFVKHNSESPLLFGEKQENDVIKERNVKSFANGQITLFDYWEDRLAENLHQCT